MPEFWAGLKFGGVEAESEAKYRTEQFRSASESIKRLREVSRAGREEMERIAAIETGKRKVVYGE